MLKPLIKEKVTHQIRLETVKKAIVLLLITYCCLKLEAQCSIPNGDFENFSEYQSSIPHPTTGLLYDYWLPDGGWTESVYTNQWSRITAGQGFFYKYEGEDANGNALELKGSGNSGFIRFECDEVPQKIKGRYKFSNTGCDNFKLFAYAINETDMLSIDDLHYGIIHDDSQLLEVTSAVETFIQFEIDMSDFEGIDIDFITIGFNVEPNGNCSDGELEGFPIIIGDSNSSVVIDDLELVYDSLSMNDNVFNNLDIDIYPNPTSNIIHIKNNNYEKIAFLTVYNVLGKRILEKKNPIQNETIDLSKFPQGIYFLKATMEKGNTKSFRVLKY